MKIRNGFVSNSSSSSFCIYGVCLDSSEITDSYEPKETETEEDEDDEVDEESCEEVLDSLLKDTDLGYWSDYNDNYYLGISLTEQEDDQTHKQFKNGIEEALKKIFPDLELKFQIYEETVAC